MFLLCFVTHVLVRCVSQDPGLQLQTEGLASISIKLRGDNMVKPVAHVIRHCHDPSILKSDGEYVVVLTLVLV